jgi:hypothetical protein
MGKPEAPASRSSLRRLFFFGRLRSVRRIPKGLNAGDLGALRRALHSQRRARPTKPNCN